MRNIILSLLSFGIIIIPNSIVFASANFSILQPNTTCSSAIPISEGAFYDLGPSIGNGSNLACYDDGATPQNASWYLYTASESGNVTVSSNIETNDYLTDTNVSIFLGTCESLTCLTFDDDGGDLFMSVVSFNVLAGESYYIAWDDKWSPVPFDFEIYFDIETFDCTDLGANFGDSCDDGNPSTNNEIIFEDCSCSPTGIFVSSVPGPVNIQCSEDIPANNPFASTNCGNGGLTRIITFQSEINGCVNVLTKTWTYTNPCGDEEIVTQIITIEDTTPPWIISAPEDVTLSCGITIPNSTAPQFYDNCAELNVNVVFSQSGDVNACPSEIVRTWVGTDYCGLTTTVQQSIFLTTDGYDCPDIMADYGDSCDDGDETTENDVILGNCTCQGTSIFYCPEIMANLLDPCDDGDPTTENDVINSFCECVGTAVPSGNSVCANSIEIIEGTYTDPGPFGGNGLFLGCFSPGSANHASWYSYTPSQNGDVTIRTDIDPDFPDTRVSIFTGDCDNLVCYASDDDSGSNFTSIVTFQVIQGETYFIEFDDQWDDGEFDFELSLVSSEGCQTDLDGSGDTNGFDFTIFLGNFGQECNVTPCPTDFNADNVTDGADFIIFLGNFGLDCE